MLRFRLRSLLLVAVGLLILAADLHAQDTRFMRDPHVSNDGHIVFSYHGDLWLVSADGEDPRRLTSHVGRDVTPRFSPDGTEIAFSSNRSGEYHVYVMPTTGGEPRQLTHRTVSDMVRSWTPDGSGIVFNSSRSTHRFLDPLYIVPADGGVPVPMPMAAASDGMISQDGSRVAFNILPANMTRQGYRGARSTNVYVQDLESRAVAQLTDTELQDARNHVNDQIPMWGSDGLIYFMSERTLPANIWRIAPGGGEPEPFTSHTDAPVRYPSVSPDGSRIVYVQDFRLWTVDVPSGEPRAVPVRLAVDPRDNLNEYVEVESRAEGFAPSPDGASVAVEFRGQLFTVPVDRDRGELREVATSPWRERLREFSPDGRFLAYVSDESGEEEIWLHEVATGERRQLTTMAQPKGSLTWAPDGSRLAFTSVHELLEVEVGSGRLSEVARNPAAGFSSVSYSADGRWLVYHRNDMRRNTDVYLRELASGQEYNVTDHPSRSSVGALTPDGRTVVFTSNRDGTNHLYAVALSTLGEDPHDPLVRAEADTADAPDDENGAAGTLDIQVDLDGIHRRAVQLTTGDDGVGSYFLSADGATAYFTSSDSDGPGLFSIGLRGGDRQRVAGGSFPGLTPTPDRRYVFFTQSAQGTGSQVHRMQLQNQRRQQVEFGFTVAVDIPGEWEQIYHETWRVMRDRFYDPGMHGVDWDAVRNRYAALLPHVGNYEDVYDLANHAIGELNASHTGVSGPPSRTMSSGYSTRYLGFEMEPADGGYRIHHIYRDGPADQEWLDLSVGDYVVAVDGVEVVEGDNYWQILNRARNEYVPVRVASAPDGAGARELRIRTVGSLNSLQYEEWIHTNRELVERESDGRLAYVHMASMNQSSLARLTRELDEYWDRQGVIIDIRYNGGGNIDQQLFDVLSRRPYQFLTGRNTPPSWGRRPYHPIAGPKVMLINWRSASNSEMTPEGFRELGLGTVVGNPTGGAVIATGSYGLINGGSMRTPGSLVVTWDPTQPHNHGINMENWGVVPDIWVKNTPEDELEGHDRELLAAVEEALRQIQARDWQYVDDSDGR